MTTTSRRWMGVGLTDVGRVRKSNQDAMLVSNELGLFVVADGMGGHAGGDVASRLAIAAFQESIAPLLTQSAAASSDSDRTEAFLRRIVDRANTSIIEEGQRTPALRSMGTTVVALSIVESHTLSAHVVHVGDSRAYLYRDHTLRQLTQDHSVVEDFVRRGLLTPEEAVIHPKRNALTRAVGIATLVEADHICEPLQPNDLLLLCTDGLTKMMDDQDLATCLREGPRQPEALCRKLVEESNRRGGNDNVTVLICTQSQQDHRS